MFEDKGRRRLEMQGPQLDRWGGYMRREMGKRGEGRGSKVQQRVEDDKEFRG